MPWSSRILLAARPGHTPGPLRLCSTLPGPRLGRRASLCGQVLLPSVGEAPWIGGLHTCQVGKVRDAAGGGRLHEQNGCRCSMA